MPIETSSNRSLFKKAEDIQKFITVCRGGREGVGKGTFSGNRRVQNFREDMDTLGCAENSQGFYRLDRSSLVLTGVKE
jgi:hypothetical protein